MPPFYADLHIHSKHSRACSRDCDLEHLAWWGKRKGITVIGTRDGERTCASRLTLGSMAFTLCAVLR
jgi:PHP family Zn ribbon phosphoesterase